MSQTIQKQLQSQIPGKEEENMADKSTEKVNNELLKLYNSHNITDSDIIQPELSD